MKITKRQLRRIIKEAINESQTAGPPISGDHAIALGGSYHEPKAMEEPSSYDLGREDSFAGIRPQSSDEDYMMGYNEAQTDAGLPTMQAPSDSGRGKPLDPDLLKGARPGKHWRSRR